jgi:uncharacterized membrane-anchored protein
MKRRALFLFALLSAVSIGVQAQTEKTLYLYDEVNEGSTPYIAVFKAAFAEKGIAYDEATAADLRTLDLKAYDQLMIHGMYMAFNMSSPIRDWLKDDPDLTGKKISLFVTSNKSNAEKLMDQLTKLLKKNKAEVIDAVSMATADIDAAGKAAAVKERVERLK